MTQALRHTLAVVLQRADGILITDARRYGLPPPVTAYDGLAGIVMELTYHPGAAGTAAELARITGLFAERLEMPPALLYGRMGVSLALHRAAGQASLTPGADDIASETRVDVTHGVAGLGIGFLALAATASDPAPYDELAGRCVQRLLREEEWVEGQLRALPPSLPGHAISIENGFAHGRAGIAYMLLAHAARSGEDQSGRRARALLDDLAALVPDLAARAHSPVARPMAASWCQGLAGIGTALARGARYFDDDGLLDAARTAATGCLAVAPRVPLVTQCCGLAGIGEFLLDLAVITGEDRYHREALRILDLMLLRSGGSRTAPSFPDTTLASSSPGWATGAGGVLSFLRRLVDPEGPRLWMADRAFAGS